MAIQKITGDVIATSAVTADSLADTTITAAKLHTTLDLTGKTVTVSTASAGDNDTTVASTAFVATAVANLADSAPDALNTLNELAAALGDDANFSTTVNASIAAKAPLASPTFTGTINSGPINSGNIAIQASGTDGTSLEVGRNSSSNHFAYVDLVGDSTYTDYGLRLIRGDSGANTNSGLYHRGTGNLLIETQEAASIGLRTAGSAALTLDASQNATFAGNVGIGTSSPQGILHIDKGASGDNITILETHSAGDSKLIFSQGQTAGNWAIGYDDGSGADENSLGFAYRSDGYPSLTTHNQMILTPAGRLGIGTTSPSSNLDVRGGSDMGIRIISDADGYASLQFGDVDDFVRGGITYYSADDSLQIRGYNNATRMTIDANGKIFMNEGLPFSWTDSSLNVSAEIYGDSSDNLVFRNTSSKTERMRIDSAGNINIGTTAKSNSYPARFITTSLATPSSGGEACHILELVGRRNQNAGNQNGMIQFWNTTSTAAETARISGIQGTGLNSGALTFATYAAGTYDEAMRIDQNGNVGIGTTAVTSPGLWYDATNDYLAISHWATPPTPAALLHLSDNSNDLDVPQIRIEGRENVGDTKLDISVRDAGVRLNLIEGPAGDASNGYGLMEFKTNAAVNVGYPTRGGFKFTTEAHANTLVITNTGDIGINIATPRSKLSINSNGAPATSTGNMANTGLTIHDGTGGTAVQLGTYNAGSWNYIQSGYVNNATVAREFRIMNGANYTMNLSNTGNVGIGTTNPNNMSHTQNTAITATQSTGNSWSTPSSGGTYSVQGAIEAAGIRNRHVAKWAFSGNLSANNWYPFTKRSELIALCNTTGSSSEEGFGMYFRIYTYLSSSGYAEYFSNRVSSTIWVTNNGSNSVQAHELYVGPGWGHAPNGGHDSDSATSCPFRMRVMHHVGNDSTWPATQTVEIRCAGALSGLNSTVSGRQLMIYGYII